MNGILYGVGIGPGDPELITLKAKKIIENCEVLVAPIKKIGEKSTAFEIIKPVVNIEGKKILEVVFTMSGDDPEYMACGKVAGDIIAEELKHGKNVAMITLGDVSIYSTFMYLQRYIHSIGFKTEIIPGIPSFCSGAALAGLPLTLGNEGLAIVPANKNEPLVDEALDKFDNMVFMKVGNNVKNISDKMAERGIDQNCATIISNVGMKNQYIGPIDLSREYGYFTTMIVKKNLK
ncbi:MAG: precorrin-2 C(20)-methyltransferase [Candidatus Methanomethylophilaceae archaeon]|nr:precorrin-2 C(20)-methyltransferase [Candidatus Methanomethylophilaceae archaeon]